MGETVQRRSTLVSRLPIFRRSSSKRQDSLPSSPSSSGVANGVHTSSPSSTNSSSSSTGKRRSLFRTPSISFHSKRSAEPRVPEQESQGSEPLAQGHGGQGSESRAHRAEDGTRFKPRHSFGFGSHRHKKITRSQTEDFDKGSTNRGLFINCISSGANEGDDSGFLDDYSSRRSSRHKKQLLPKSFSSHHRFSKQHAVGVPEQCDSLEVSADPPRLLTPGSGTSEFGDGSLQSPMVSEDRTTAITPSEFVPVTEDSVSEVDAGPVMSPAAAPEALGHLAAPSQVHNTPAPAASAASTASEKPSPPETSTVSTACDAAPPLAPHEPDPADEPAENGPAADEREPDSSNPEQRPDEETQRRLRNPQHAQEARKAGCNMKAEVRPSHLRKPHTVSVGSSSSPYHEVKRLERRLRSASEGAGGPRLHLNLREPHLSDSQALLQHRTSSSSSKLGSLDVLNNLGSSELDEDDLMLDLDLSDDQRQHRVSREDSSQSLSTCLALLPSPMECGPDNTFTKEAKVAEPLYRDTPSREPVRPTSLLPCDWCLPRDEDLVGLEGLPFTLMLQDCTAVKTMLLRLTRILQESTDTSPATSLHSLPISPCSDKSLPFKDPGREENSILLLQLKDKDELIQRLQAELDKAGAAQKPPCPKADKCTQTELSSPEVAHPSSAPGQSVLLRDRRSTRSLMVERAPPAAPLIACEDRKCPPLNLQGGSSREGVTGASLAENGHPRTAADGPMSQIPRAMTGTVTVTGSSCSLPGWAGSPSRSSQSSDSERGGRSSSERVVMPRQAAGASFTGRLGQPPRGPLSLHVYSRKNVFLQHSLHTADLQALAQQDS